MASESTRSIQPNAPRHNLPPPATTFIGRNAEVALVAARLQRPGVRLLTLTGPGGTGKTRLAQQVARAVVDAYPDGVFFVELTPVRDPAFVAATVAEAVGLTET